MDNIAYSLDLGLEQNIFLSGGIDESLLFLFELDLLLEQVVGVFLGLERAVDNQRFCSIAIRVE